VRLLANPTLLPLAVPLAETVEQAARREIEDALRLTQAGQVAARPPGN